MNEPFEDEALVVDRKPTGDADLIATFLTAEHGKIIARVKGVRKANAKNAPGLDLFCLSTIELTPGHGYPVLIRATPINPWGLSQNLDASTRMRLVAEVSSAAAYVEEADYELFAEILEYRDSALKAGIAPESNLLQALCRIADHSGYTPQLQDCAECGQLICAIGSGAQNDKWVHFAPSYGAVVHIRCVEPGTPTRRCSREGVILLQEAFAGLSALSLPSPHHAEARDLLLGHLAYQFGYSFQAAKMLRALENGTLML